MSRIGIFGGSFDPIHNGHIGVAERAMRKYALDRILVVPARISPFKLVRSPRLDDDARWRMVVAACKGHPGLEPLDIELKRGGVSYAIDTVLEIKDAHPDDTLFFIVGEDSVKGLEHWKDWDRLKTLCTFISFPRTSESSTEIRRRMAAGEPFEDMVPPAVAELLLAGAPPCATLLPQRPPMVLIDAVESFDASARSLAATAAITPKSPFHEAGGVPSWAAIEYMAQTVAALVCRMERVDAPAAIPRPGFLLGTRRLSLHLDRFDCGRTYHIHAREEYADDNAAAFDCRISDDSGAEVASAIVNTYRPSDIKRFLQ